MKQKEYFGHGSIKYIKKIMQKEKIKNIFIVAGKKSFELSGAKRKLKLIFKKYNVKIFDDFSPNPTIEDIKKGFKKFEKDNFDIILGVGGGSSIDTAKAIKLFYFEKYKENIPLVAIPTTSGSGSEATYFIVYYDKKKKISDGKRDLTLPEISILDPSLISSLPKKIKASTAMDAFGQAIESYWSINSTNESKKFSRKAIKLLMKNIHNSVNDNDKKANKKLMLASNLSGKAINITKTTACHAVSYPLTSYFGIPHGHAVMLTIPKMLEYNSEINEKNCKDKRGSNYVKKTIKEILAIIRTSNIVEGKDKIEKLMLEVNLEIKLRNLGISKSDFDTIINNINLKRLKNNPRILNEEDLKNIIKEIY